MVANSIYKNDEIAELEKKAKEMARRYADLKKEREKIKELYSDDDKEIMADAIESYNEEMDPLKKEWETLKKEIEVKKQEQFEKQEKAKIDWDKAAKKREEKQQREKIERIDAISDFLKKNLNIYDEYLEKLNGDNQKLLDEVYKDYRDDINQIILDKRNKEREDQANQKELEAQKEKEAKEKKTREDIDKLSAIMKGEQKVTEIPAEEPKKEETPEPVKDEENSYEMTAADLRQSSEIKSIQEQEGLSWDDAVKKYWENRKEAEPVVEEVPSPLTFEESLENKTDNILDNINETNNESKEAKPVVAAPALPEEKQPETPNKEPEEVPVTPIENKPPVEQIQSDPSVSFEENDSEIDEEPKTNDIPDDAEEEKLLKGRKQEEDSKWSIRRAVKNIANRILNLFNKSTINGDKKIADQNIINANSPEPDNKTFRANTIMSTNDTNFKDIADEVVNVDNTTYKKEMNR